MFNNEKSVVEKVKTDNTYLFQTGSKVFYGGYPVVKSDHSGLSETLMSKIYNEQFVFRLSVLMFNCTENESLVVNIINNLTSNLDVKDSKLLSVELENQNGDTFPYSLHSLMPDFIGNSVQEIKGGNYLAPNVSFPYTILGEREVTTNESDFFETVACVFDGKYRESSEFTINILGVIDSEPVSLVSRVCGSKNVDAITLLGLDDGTRTFPTWEFQNGKLIRNILIPHVDSVEKAFNVSKGYPTSVMMGDIPGVGLRNVFLFSSIPVVSDLAKMGMVIEEYVFDGVNPEINYSLFFDVKESRPLVIQLGNERSAIEYFLRLSESKKTASIFELLLSIEEQMNIEPEEVSSFTLN